MLGTCIKKFKNNLIIYKVYNMNKAYLFNRLRHLIFGEKFYKKLKTNLVRIENALDKIEKLNLEF